MKMPWFFPWDIFHGQSAPLPGNATRRVTTRNARRVVGVETLEDRLALSSSPYTYAQWADQSIRLDDMAPEVVQPSQDVAAQDAKSGQLIGLDKVRANTPYRGSGYSVAVIDTGIDYTHPDLGGGWGTRVIAGWDFVNNDADPRDDNGHGTHVAGIIGSSGASYAGVAPDVNLIALKVLGANGSGNFGHVEAALQWVLAHQVQYNIVAINLSLGSGNYSVSPFEFMDDEFRALNEQDVFIAIASGNSYYAFDSQPGMAFPGVNDAVVAVGAVWSGDFGSVTWLSGAKDITTAADRVASFTQRDVGLDLLAPGAMITSTYLRGQYTSMAGTSMATPMVAGAAALIHEALDQLGHADQANQANILSILQRTGATVIDGDDENDNVVNTGLSFKRIDVAAAIASLTTNPAPNPPPDSNPGTNLPPVLSPIADQRIKPGQSLTVPLAASDPNGQALVFSAQLVDSAVGSPAYELKQRLGLSYMGSYYTNSWGANEKWLLGSGDVWYCLLPNGELRQWAGTIADTLLPANLLATLGTEFYQDPALLYNAVPPSGAADVSILLFGNQLRIIPAETYGGSFQVRVTVSDGQTTASRTFLVTVNNTGPTFVGLGDVTMRTSFGAGIITLRATDPDSDVLIYGARLAGSSALAVQLKQKLGLTFTGNYRLNARGASEKWLAGSGGAQYIVLPNGELRRWAGTMAATLTAKNLLGTFDASFYADPRKLWNPVQPSIVVVGNLLSFRVPSTYLGSFTLEASVTDGEVVTAKTFTVTVSNQAPALSVSTQTSVGSATLTLDATDADGDALSYQARVSTEAYDLYTRLGLRSQGAFPTNHLGLDEVWFKGKVKNYYLLPSGELRLWTGKSSILVATLDPIYRDEPTLLTATVKPRVTVAVDGNQVIVTPAAGFTGKVAIELQVSDGTTTTRKLVVVTV